MDWFLYDRELRRERVKIVTIMLYFSVMSDFLVLIEW